MLHKQMLYLPTGNGNFNLALINKHFFFSVLY